ncbi:primosomal protein N' [Telmatospirillum sp. J64-1]|uniref:primosomal protein N' n=1 Tax=Telmatospirillum sp. J64-1 TaxID=2502183 RepID=UPI00115D77EA|nr:primosomal protein N' [Telmatospirillum sp. J64-1]
MPSHLASSEPLYLPFVSGERVAVLLPLPLSAPYDYTVPPGMNLGYGDFVVVPLSGREVVGVVWAPGEGSIDAKRLKPVRRRLDVPPMPEPLRKLVDWVAAYTLALPGTVLKMAMSVPAALEPARPVLGVKPAAEPASLGLRMTPARMKVLEAAARSAPIAASELAKQAGVGPAVVRGLVEAGALEQVPLDPVAESQPDWHRPGPTLSAAQREAAADMVARVQGRSFSAVVLEGVTGSGKTEVYFEAMAAALEQGQQVLVLLPEIALGAQWLERFARRFGAPPLQWHSDLGQAQRRETWRAVAEGRGKVVVGARSALFLPFPDLGLIIVDEEHESSFKQEEGVIYHARDMAVVRGHLGGHPVVLASATPSLETLYNVRAGKYRHLHLPERHGGAGMPDLSIIDMRKHPPPRGQWISPVLAEAVEQTLAAGEQAMLFLNRRGYAPLTLCRTCGHRLQCPNCTAWLVEHRLLGRLQCHHCGHSQPSPKECPSCGDEDSMVPCGPGVERLAEEVAHRFPDTRWAVMASDTITSPAQGAELVRQVTEHEIDLLIGTQIVAKGYHFPMLTLVGVVDGDLGLSGGDLRAAERTYQLLSQVAGRAGRAERPGRVLLQSFEPDHPVMQALARGDHEGFIREETEQRRAAGMPPFGRLAALIVSGADEARVERMARALGRAAPHGPGLDVLGPAPAPMALLRGRHRRRLLLKTSRDVAIQTVLRRWLAGVEQDPAVRVQVDVDPFSFL